ncbi:MAG TPA: hypothetical protein VK694_00505 [Verrucomicrobiae bacterium]|nr:hypothetical protein [Verrucomicrobiae bacterium]
MNEYFAIREYRAKNAKKVLFFFPAGFTKMWHYRWTVFVLNRMGITVVGFNFAWKKAIRKCNFDNMVDLIKQVDQAVSDTMSQYPQGTQYSD